MNTLIKYGYARDGVKKVKTDVLNGVINEDDIMSISQGLREGRFFIPEQVGLVSMADGNADDHVWHHIDVEQIRATALPASLEVSAADFVDRMSTASWNVVSATAKMYEGCHTGMRI